MPVSYHMVHYRSFQATDKTVGSLEGLCRSALNTVDGGGTALWQRASDRVFDLGDGNGTQVLLNRVADLSSAVFGEMCLVESKGLQALLDLRASNVKLSNITLAQIYDLQERTAPTGSRFIRGLAYWLTVGNHTLLVRTQSLTMDRIAEYFGWLLKKGKPTASKPLDFTFRAALDKAADAGDVGEIRKMKVSSKSRLPMLAAVEDLDGPPQTRLTERAKKAGSVVSEKAAEIARLVFGAGEAQSLLNSLGPNEYLAAEASVSVRGKRTEASKQKMRELVDSVADDPGAIVQVEGKDGRLTNGDAILRVNMPFSVPQEGSTLLEFDNVADQLQVVYQRFVDDGKITAG